MPFTPVFNIELPDVGGDENTWGNIVNNALNAVDGIFTSGPVLPVEKGGTGANNATDARANLGYGSIATQDSSSVSVGTLTAENIGVKTSPTEALDINGTLKASSLNLTGTMSVSGTASYSGNVTIDSGNVNSYLKIPNSYSITDINGNNLVGFGCGVRKASDYTISSNTEYVISWDEVLYDHSNMWSSGTNITLPKPGLYLVNLHWCLNFTTAGPATAYLYSGTSKVSGATIYPNGTSSIRISSFLHRYISGGSNYIKLSVHNGSSNNATLKAISGNTRTKVFVICMATF